MGKGGRRKLELEPGIARFLWWWEVDTESR